MKSTITPCLWFDGKAEQAMNFYLSLFKNSKVLNVSRYGKSGPGPEGSVLMCVFEIDGQALQALNGGPHYHFTPAISLSVNCETQAEVDRLWDALTADGGRADRCGWLTDKFGLSWQIVPSIMGEIIGGKDPAGAARAMQAMFKMQKLDIATLKKAYEGN